MQIISQNVRFWVFHNDDWSLVTLKPGQTVQLVTGKTTDEGYECTTLIMDYDAKAGIVGQLTAFDGCDCDGRISRTDYAVWDLSSWRDLDPEYAAPDHRMPEWEDAPGSCRRDQFAELAGY